MGEQIMTDLADHPVSTGDVADKLHMRKLFLRGLVWSLAAAALIAICVLLFGEFNRTTGRVLGTLAALALHSGLALALAEFLERHLWPRLNRIGLAIFSLNFAVLTTFIWWWPNGREDEMIRAMLTTVFLIGAYILALPGADLLERGRHLRRAAMAILTLIVALLMSLVCIWARDTDSPDFVKATVIAGIAAFTLAHTCLLSRVRRGQIITALLAVTLVSAWALAALLSLFIITEYDQEFGYRFVGALGVLDAAGSLSLLILLKLRSVGRGTQLETSAAEFELCCPRCLEPQTVTAGASACRACGLKFRIEIEEPRCEKCGYLLYQLPERTCPECGTPF